MKCGNFSKIERLEIIIYIFFIKWYLILLSSIIRYIFNLYNEISGIIYLCGGALFLPLISCWNTSAACQRALRSPREHF